MTIFDRIIAALERSKQDQGILYQEFVSIEETGEQYIQIRDELDKLISEVRDLEGHLAVLKQASDRAKADIELVLRGFEVEGWLSV